MACVLTEISKYCNGLSSGRQTERKTCISKLLERLKDSEVQKLVDENSQNKQRKITWDYMSRLVFNNVIAEVEILQGATKKLAEKTILQRKIEISETFRSFIQSAEKRGACLKSTSVYNHILNVMQCSDTREWLSNDYTSCLLKHFLYVNDHANEITLTIWHSFVKVYCECVLEPPRKADMALIWQTINQLMVIAKNLPYLSCKELYSFFEETFKNFRQKRSDSLMAIVMCSLNNFCTAMAPDCRRQLIHLGENIFPTLMPFWTKSSSQFKDELMKFFIFQMKIHCPHGVANDDNGANWKGCVHKLHGLIENDFQQLAGKIQKTGPEPSTGKCVIYIIMSYLRRTKAEKQKESFILLAVEYYHQVLQMQKSVPLEASQKSGESCRKKRKIESSWTVIRDGLSKVTHSTSCIAWLQLFTSLIKKYPHDLPSQEYLPFLTSLYQADVACKKADVKRFFTEALCILAHNAAIFGAKDDGTEEIWGNIWLNNLKQMYSNIYSDYSGFALLIAIIKNEIITPKEEPFTIIFNLHSQLSNEALKFLLLLMQKYTIPSRINNGTLVGKLFEENGKFQLRQHLIRLVFPAVDFSNENKTFMKSLSHITCDSLRTLTLIINGLQQKNTFIPAEDAAAVLDKPDNENTNNIDDIERLYIISSFSSNFLHKEEAIEQEHCLKSDNNHCSGKIEEIYNYIYETIKDVTSGIITLHGNEEYMKTNGSDTGCDWFHLCVKYASVFCQLFLNCKDNDSEFTLKIKELLAKSIGSLLNLLTDFANDFFKNAKVEQEQKSQSIIMMVDYLDAGMTKHPGTAAENFAKVVDLFPRRFFEFLLGVITNENGKKSSSPDDMDIDDFDSYDSCSTVFTEFNGSQDRLRSRPSSGAENLRVVLARFLLKFVFPGAEIEHLLARKLSRYKELLLEFLEQTFDPTCFVSTSVLTCIINHVCDGPVAVVLPDKEIIIELLRKFISSRRNDQDACVKGLSLLCKFMDFLTSSSDETLSHLKGLTMRMLSAFWNLKTEKYCPKLRMILVDCFLKLLQIDPHQQWSDLAIKTSSNRAGENHGSSKKIPDLLLHFLSDPCHQVRMKAAGHVVMLFQSVPHRDEVTSPSQQFIAFDKVANALTDLIIFKNTLDHHEDLDANFTSTLLLVIKQISLSSKLCESKALALLFHDYKQNFLDNKLVAKVFREISKENGYADERCYLKDHFGYICGDWMKRGFPIIQFPCSVVNMDIKQFLRYYCGDIVPYVLFYRDEKSFNEIQQKLEEELLIKNFHRIIIFSLPYYACQTSSTGMRSSTSVAEQELQTEQAKRAYEFLEKKLTKQVIERLLVEKFDEIVIELLFTMYDPPSEGSDASQFMRESDPPPNPPFFTSNAIKETLKYLANCYQSQSIIGVLSKRKDSIQKILLSLATRVCQARNDKVRILCSYRLFVYLLVENFNSLGLNRAFFVRDVIYRCCHWLNGDIYKSPDDRAFSCVWQVLHEVVEACINASVEEFADHVSLILSSLAKYKMDDNRGQKAKMMIKKLKSSFQNEDRLDGLLEPSQLDYEVWDYFAELIQNEQYIQSFMQLNFDDSSKVLAFISKLLKIASSLRNNADDNATNAKIIIARCLGEIGPINCHALALPLASIDENPDDKSFFGSNERAHQHHLVLDYLCCLQIDENIEISAVASNALKDALHTATGIQHTNLFDIIHEDDKPKFFLYSQPFKAGKTKKGSQPSQGFLRLQKPTPNEFHCLVDSANLWTPGWMRFESWIKQLTSTIISSGAIQDEIFLSTTRVCESHVNFAKMMLPLLVHNIISNCSEEFKQILSASFNRFLSSYLTQRSRADDNTLNCNEKNNYSDRKRAARAIIDVVTYLRKQDLPSNARSSHVTKWDNNFWLDVNYFELAQVAFDCSSYFTAVMFTEVWCDIQRDKVAPDCQDSLASSQESQLEAVDVQSAASCQRLLFEAYLKIGEPDGIYGVDTGCSKNIPMRIKEYEFEKEFEKALLLQNLHLSSEDYSSQLQFAKNTEKSGLHQFMLQAAQNATKGSSEFEELRYEAAWRLGVWDLEPNFSKSNTQEFSGLSENIYSSILALKEGDEGQFKLFVDKARLGILLDEEDNRNISTVHLYKYLSKLTAVSQLEAYGNQYFSNSLDLTRSGVEQSKLVIHNEFEYYELSLSVKAAALKATLARESMKENSEPSIKIEIGQLAYQHLLQTAALAREAKNYQICERQLAEIRKMASVADFTSEWKIEEAKMLWDRGETNRAMNHLKSLLRLCRKGSSSADFYPTALGLYGHWLAETRTENPAVIIEHYLEHAACLLEDSQCSETRGPEEAYFVLAKYADSQYKRLQDYTKSANFDNKQNVIKKVKEEIHRLEELPGSSTTRYYRRLVAQRDEDQSELQQMLKDRKQFLKKALENYVRCLCGGDNYDLHVFRLCALWLENSNEDFVNQIINECLTKMQSRKFVPLMYQLAARMGQHGNMQFKSNLEQLIEKTGNDHPHHVLIIIIALCNVEEETEEQSNSTSRRSKLSKRASETPKKKTTESRVESANAVLARLRKVKPNLVISMQGVMAAYMELAYYDISHLKRQTGKFDLPSKLRLRRVRDVVNVAIPTLDLPIDPSCKYNRITYISAFDTKFTHCGGINLPKVITCIGSDGKRRKQLVKGRDDLRQDAVMQQVFGMVNRLLQESSETRKRELRIRTYKVIPLSQRSGIVEWCENTVPLGDYLVGNRAQPGAHPRYHPTDWTAMDCRKKLTEATLGNGKKSKHNVFLEIMRNFRPVFRHFFYEKFTEPADWFARRLAYTRSLATSSIVGYVVGLGDRHVQNILIDFNTAELVHIDLGVAFEQGKQLPTPETIPFRLTRDLVDGLGVAGVEGIFRRCCENTMQLMRNSQESILTIVEVLLYDPLYEWTLSPLKAVQLQECTESSPGLLSAQPQQADSKNSMAQRVLVRLRQKLDGDEDGSFLSTQGQVNYLVQSARDSNNLCRVELYRMIRPGWECPPTIDCFLFWYHKLREECRGIDRFLNTGVVCPKFGPKY
eukprot:gene17373-19112_t